MSIKDAEFLGDTALSVERIVHLVGAVLAYIDLTHSTEAKLARSETQNGMHCHNYMRDCHDYSSQRRRRIQERM